MNFRLISVFIFFIISSIIFSQQINKIAITIDDLPLQRMGSFNQGEYEKIFDKLINEIKLQKAYAIGFAINNQLYTNGKIDKAKVKLIKNWINAGLDLGNHTFSHKSAHKVPLAEYEDDISKGEEIIKELLQKKGKQLKYFRHPFLNTGLSLEVKNELNTFLKDHGYTIAPVTIDNSEWIFAFAYEIAYKNNDGAMLKKIGEEYLLYMKSKIEYYEEISNTLFGRNISHVLLVHGNRLNSEYYSALISMIRNMNYEFVSLDEALKDEAYKSEDKYIRNAGISWLTRWARTMGKKNDFFAGDPACPEYIMKYAKVDSE